MVSSWTRGAGDDPEFAKIRAACACVMFVLAVTASVAAAGEVGLPPKVTVVTPIEEPVPSYFETTGDTEAVNSIDLVARAQGFIQEISYIDGAFVTKGTPLFTIEPELYNLKLETAKAAVARTRAALTQAEGDFKRQAELIVTQATSKSAYDKALALLEAARADLRSALADQKAAEINLSYTKVAAPFDGVVTRRQVSLGQFVGADSEHPTVLATIVQADPICVTFSVSEREAQQIRADLLRRGQNPRTSLLGLPVEVGLQSDNDNLYRGTLDYMAPVVDPITKRLAARARLTNADLALLPGYSVRLRGMLSKLALLVPDAALGSDQSGEYVLVVNKDSMVERRTVDRGQLVRNLRVIEQGLTKDDRVIVGGMHAMPGQKVDAEPGSPPAAH
jgi:RND family efflux transporter MFP subunit